MLSAKRACAQARLVQVRVVMDEEQKQISLTIRGREKDYRLCRSIGDLPSPVPEQKGRGFHSDLQVFVQLPTWHIKVSSGTRYWDTLRHQHGGRFYQNIPPTCAF